MTTRMTDVSEPSPGAAPATADGQHLQAFLATAQVNVLDVRRGVASGTRRLIVGRRADEYPTYAVAVADAHSACAILAESRLLSELTASLPPELLATVPGVVGPVDMAGRAALVVTSCATSPARSRLQLAGKPPRTTFDAVLTWLHKVWRETAGVRGHVDLGRDASDVLLARYAGSAQLATTLSAAHWARHRMGAVTTPRTVSHGCLCLDHVVISDGTVIEVADWSGGSTRAEPLRDLGCFAVSCAGDHLPEVVSGRTAYAHAVRDFVGAGLEALDLPPVRWRDVLVLTQVERAVAALELGHVADIDLLIATVRALPRKHRSERTETT